MTFRRRTFAESDDQLQLFVPGGGQDRVFRVDVVRDQRPVQRGRAERDAEPREDLRVPPVGGRGPAGLRRAGSSARSRRARIGGRSRRSDLAELLEYYRDGVAAGGFEEGIRSAVTGILASPYFLYRFEQPPRRREARSTSTRSTTSRSPRSCRSSSGTRFPTTSCSRSRRAASSATRKSSSSRSSGCSRTRARTRSRSNFVFHWLDMKRLEEVEPDRAIFPYASGRGDPRDDYLTELELFAKSIFDEDRSVVEFLTAKHTYLNERARAALRHQRREGRSVPTRGAQGLDALGSARQGRDPDGGRVPEPHVAGAARRVHPRVHQRHAADGAAARACRRSPRTMSARRRSSRSARSRRSTARIRLASPATG